MICELPLLSKHACTEEMLIPEHKICLRHQMFFKALLWALFRISPIQCPIALNAHSTKYMCICMMMHFLVTVMRS